MKKSVIYSLAIGAGVWLLSACGGNTDTSNGKQSETTVQESATTDPSTLPVKEIEVNTTGNTMAEMKFDVTELHAAAGQKVKVTLHNKSVDEAMQHNIVFIKKGTGETVGIAGMQAGLSKNFTPDSPDVIAGSDMIGPGKSTTFEFTAPLEKGEYEFICTYPGHFTIMKGVFMVE